MNTGTKLTILKVAIDWLVSIALTIVAVMYDYHYVAIGFWTLVLIAVVYSSIAKSYMFEYKWYKYNKDFL